MTVRSSIAAHNQSLHIIDSILIASYIDSVSMFIRQRSGYICKLLGKSNHLILVGSVVGSEAGSIMMLDLGRRLLHIDVIKAKIFHQLSVFLIERQFQYIQ